MKNEKRVVKSMGMSVSKSGTKASQKSKKPALASTTLAPEQTSTVRLELYAPEAREVYVAGSFNGWDPANTALHIQGQGRWARELVLPPGRYEYLFLVDGQWLPDPQAQDYAPNPFGGQNSLIEVRQN